MKKISTAIKPANTISQINVISVTIVSRDHVDTTKNWKETKTFRKAAKAAEWYASRSCYDWWCRLGHAYTHRDRYERLDMRQEKMYKRVLPIFQQHLP
jgi:hypothetical protein